MVIIMSLIGDQTKVGNFRSQPFKHPQRLIIEAAALCLPIMGRGACNLNADRSISGSTRPRLKEVQPTLNY